MTLIRGGSVPLSPADPALTRWDVLDLLSDR